MHRIEGGLPTNPNIDKANSAPAKIEKNCRIISQKTVSSYMRNIWSSKIDGLSNLNPVNSLLRSIRKFIQFDTKAKSIAIKTLSLNDIGFNSSRLFNKLAEIKNMPSDTLDQKAAKEKKFRQLIKTQYDLRIVTADGNNGLRAVIISLHAELDPKTEDTLSMMLRGDMIHHIMKNPQNYTHFLKENDKEDEGLLNAVLMTYCDRMKNPEEKIGTIEMLALSDILRTPIYLHSYIDPDIDTNNHLMPSQEKMLGAHYNREPIHLYFDPLQGHYMSMKRKH